MKGLIAMHKILVVYKAICRNNEMGITYNEFICLLALGNKRSYVGSISKELLMDRSLTIRTLASLAEKGLVQKGGGREGEEQLYSFH